MNPQLIRCSERPELWDAITGLRCKAGTTDKRLLTGPAET